MEPAKLVRIILLLGLVTVCFSNQTKLTEEEIKFLSDHVKSWKAPLVLEVVSGTSQDTNIGKELRMHYYSEDDQNCTVVYTKDKETKEHDNYQWVCRKGAESEPPLGKKFKEKFKKEKDKKEKENKEKKPKGKETMEKENETIEKENETTEKENETTEKENETTENEEETTENEEETTENEEETTENEEETTENEEETMGVTEDYETEDATANSEDYVED